VVRISPERQLAKTLPRRREIAPVPRPGEG
jgi:hypothetical protein